ncbi:hypothetical protein PIB30_000107 [Stylosanthes scabra]|uniref:Uncharacterized protein n=1 Tax=Stylosanthes scabra TaxID=79078 RepID=A0ABU6R3G4_9FABA|nr:hypothetical protein [Stylosanthes scabra]
MADLSESESDNEVEKCNSSKSKKHEQRKKHKHAPRKQREVHIETDDSSYEGIEEEESESDVDEEAEYEGLSDAESWESEDSNHMLDSDEGEPSSYPRYNDKAKFGNLKFEVGFDSSYAGSHAWSPPQILCVASLEELLKAMGQLGVEGLSVGMCKISY